MHYFITGGTGFIGRVLVAELVQDGHQVTVWTRSIARARTVLPPQARAIERLADISDADIVINLAGGKPQCGTLDPELKQAFIDSRIGLTRQLVDWIANTAKPPDALISGSAVSFYGARSDRRGSEGVDFTEELCKSWEAEAMKADKLGVRVCRLRIGVVLERDGGALQKMLLPFKLGVGGPLGTGKQWMSWIHRLDLIRLIRWLAENDEAVGAYNGTAPNPVTNAEFARTLARVLNRPAFLKLDAWLLEKLFGEMSDLLLRGYRVLPQESLDQGFEFWFPNLDTALRDIFSRR